MIGAIVGDVVGSRFIDGNCNSKNFELFEEQCHFTDNTILVCAVAKGIIDSIKDKLTSERAVTALVEKRVRDIGSSYPHVGYGEHFKKWLFHPTFQSYWSCGNGSATRVASVGWLFDDIFTTRRYASMSARITHDHPEGIKGAEAVASAVFLARRKLPKIVIRQYIVGEFGYDLSFTYEDMRNNCDFDTTCQGTVPQAIVAFLDANSFEDTIRNAVSLGGDSSAIASVAGAIAEAYYGIPVEIKDKAMELLDQNLRKIVEDFNNLYESEVI